MAREECERRRTSWLQRWGELASRERVVMGCDHMEEGERDILVVALIQLGKEKMKGKLVKYNMVSIGKEAGGMEH